MMTTMHRDLTRTIEAEWLETGVVLAETSECTQSIPQNI